MNDVTQLTDEQLIFFWRIHDHDASQRAFVDAIWNELLRRGWIFDFDAGEWLHDPDGSAFAQMP